MTDEPEATRVEEDARVGASDAPLERIVSLVARGRLATPRGCVVREGSPPFATRVLHYGTKRVSGDPLVVTFHGALNPANKQKHGFFEGGFLVALGGPIGATIVGVGDPSVSVFPSLRAGWYQGHSGQAVADELTELVAALVAGIRPSRLVFVGGSSGGHPALVQSFRFPGSACVMVNPHTCISRYRRLHVRDYRQMCWPELAEDAALAAVAVDDVADLYRGGHENTIVYLQNSRDEFHVRGQMVPFLRRLPDHQRLVMQCMGFDGFDGHKFPRNEWRRWVLAVLAAPSIERREVVAAYCRTFGVAVGKAQSTSVAAPATIASKAPTHQRDLEIAGALAHCLKPKPSVAPPIEGVKSGR